MAIKFQGVPAFKWADWLIWGFLCLGSTMAAIWSTLTPGNPIPGLVLVWVVCLCFWGIAALNYYHRSSALKNLQFTTRHGIIVGWTDAAYAVRPEVVESATEDLIVKMLQMYPDAPNALVGCVALFREPSWLQCTPGIPGRMVAGLQDDSWLYVGFNQDLSKTAFEHELSHRVLQVYANDPLEDKAHAIMAQLGIS